MTKRRGPAPRKGAPGAAKRGSTARRSKRLFAIRLSPIQGQGAFALRRIPRGTRIIEYTGERITHEVADARYDDEAMERHHTYLFTVDERTVIDAAVGGNESRIINHSCDPNCVVVIARGRIFIDAIQDIPSGEELCYDYSYEREEDDDAQAEKLYPCRCGARRCRGTILSPKG
jgi:hypothetical protein